MLVVHKQVNSLRIMVTEYKKIAKGKKKKIGGTFVIYAK